MIRTRRTGMVTLDALLSGAVLFLIAAGGYGLAVYWANGFGLMTQVAIDLSM